MTEQKNIFLDEFNEYFQENGAWEQGNGMKRTELFAYYFDQVITFPTGKFTLLDVGCALGQAAIFFAHRYPEATISATDVADVAVSRGRAQYGDMVNFLNEDIEQIQEQYDVIYCSNVLEHFHDFRKKTSYLANHCKRLCIMVPYDQREAGKKLVPDPNNFEHQHSFYGDSFDFLLEDGLAKNIESSFHPCPIAWGWNRRQRITHGLNNVIRRIRRQPIESNPTQIIFDIKTTL